MRNFGDSLGFVIIGTTFSVDFGTLNTLEKIDSYVFAIAYPWRCSNYGKVGCWG